jgi:UDP-GlcNAc:undecaprenyl-phosphate GlcNAc-1-phosphate transferase
MAAVLMAVLVGLAFLFWSRSFGCMERAVAYAIGAAMVYLSEKDSAHQAFGMASDIYFVVLAGVVAAFAFFGSARRFRMTPLDFLVIFIAAAAPNIPGAMNGDVNYGMIVAKSIVLFYALEMVLAGERMQWRAMRIVQIVALAVMMLRVSL